MFMQFRRSPINKYPLFQVIASFPATAVQVVRRAQLRVPRSPEYVARDILKRISPQMLIVDEVLNLLAGSAREQRGSLNLLKYLATRSG